jgi:hypothetical protein
MKRVRPVKRKPWARRHPGYGVWSESDRRLSEPP